MLNTNFITRGLEKVVLEALNDARIIAILGPRQSGKSTLLQYMCENSFPGRYITLDDTEPRERAQNDPIGFLADLKTPLAIDEVQRAPELLLALKRAVDSDNTKGKYLLSGSTNIAVLPTLVDALPGRIDYLNLWPMAMYELQKTESTFIPQLFTGTVPELRSQNSGRAAYAENIVLGGYPEVHTRSKNGRSRFFQGLLNSAIYHDGQDLWSGNPDTSLRVVKTYASRSANLINNAAFARDIGVDGKTLKSHLDVLEHLFLIRRQPAWFSNLGKRLVKSPKGYVADTGMLCHLLGVDEQRIINDGSVAGIAFETFVAMELLRQSAILSTEISMYHYRDVNGGEVDIVIEKNDSSIVCIEVKASSTVTRKDFSTMRKLKESVGDKFKCGVVLHTGAETMPHGDLMWSVPISGLWQT